MIRPWLVAALFAASFVSLASAQVPSNVAAKFLRDEGIVFASSVGESAVFKALVDGDKYEFDAAVDRVTTYPEFDALVVRARALDAQFARFPTPEAGPLPEPRGPAISPDEQGRLSNVVKNAQDSATQLLPSIRFQGGVGQGDDGKLNGSGGAMFRLGVGNETWGSVGPQAGLIWSGSGSSNRLLSRELVDYNRWGTAEIYEETTRRVSGLNKIRFGGVSYQSPLIGGRVALEAGIDIGYARLNTAPEIVRETYLRELVYYGYCNNGYGCETWQTRTLDRETLAHGRGHQQSGLGHTTYVAAQVSLSRQWALRAEVAKDSFKAFPEASGRTISGGVVFNLGK